MKSTNPETDSEDIETAFSLLNPWHVNIQAFYEHGQWWVLAENSKEDDAEQETYSVCDAVGAPDTVCDGLSFELV